MIKNLFISPIYYAPLTAKGLKALNRDLLQECLKLREIDEAGQEWSAKNYVKGYTSYGSIANLHQFSTTFEDLRKQIDKHVRKYAKHLDMDIDLKCLQMSSCWINIMPPESLHTAHIHPLSVISGTYYVQTPKNCSAIKFEDPRLVNFMASPPRKENAREYNKRFVELKPEAGNLVLFESWMRHEVPMNQAHSERISISFNYDWN